MAKRWVLETHTKGTGANVVRVDDEKDPAQPAREREPEVVFVHPPTRPKPPKPPAPRVPRQFKVVDVRTREVLAEDATIRETLDALRDVRSDVDVAVSVRRGDDGRYRLLTRGEQQALWARRDVP
jgi:hypothetical protein